MGKARPIEKKGVPMGKARPKEKRKRRAHG